MVQADFDTVNSASYGERASARSGLPEFQLLHDTLAQVAWPSTVLSWLSKDAVRVLLAELAAGRRPLTHTTLDHLPPLQPCCALKAADARAFTGEAFFR